MKRQFESIVQIAALSLALALTGCIFPPELRSSRVDIPVSERSIDQDLPGSYWQLERPDGLDAYAPQIVTISPDSDRTYRIEYRDTADPSDGVTSEDSVQVVVVTTAHPGLDLVLYNGDEGTAYVLVVRGRAGAVSVFPFLGEQEAGLGTTRTRYLAEIARRHGIELRWDNDQNAALLAGRLNKAGLAALFSDLDFLGGLRLETKHAVVLLPASRPIPPPSDPLAWWPRKWPSYISSDTFALSARDLVQPRQLQGAFCENGQHATIAAQDDGSLLISYPPAVDGSLRPPRRIRLIDIGQRERFLMLWETVEGAPLQARFHYFVLSLSQNGGAWQEPIRADFNDASAILDQAKLSILHQAANRHGLKFDGDSLTGSLTPANLRGLLADPQFLAGIRPETGVTLDSLEPALEDQGKMVCPGANKSAIVTP